MEKKEQKAHYVPFSGKPGETPILVSGDYKEDLAEFESLVSLYRCTSMLYPFLYFFTFLKRYQ